MKWLKLFEGFNTDKYYIKIDIFEYINSIKYDDDTIPETTYHLDDDFSSEEINKIKKIFPGLSIRYEVGWDNNQVSFTSVGKSLFISKREDDWYYVCIGPDDSGSKGYIKPTYYKCDQWEGLIMLMRNVFH